MTNLLQQAYYSQFTNKRNKAVQVRWVAQNLNPDILNTCSLYHTASQGTRTLFIPRTAMILTHLIHSLTYLSYLFKTQILAYIFFSNFSTHLNNPSTFLPQSFIISSNLKTSVSIPTAQSWILLFPETILPLNLQLPISYPGYTLISFQLFLSTIKPPLSPQDIRISD